MATTPPDPHPDSAPQGDPGAIEQPQHPGNGGRESVEDVPGDRKDSSEPEEGQRGPGI